jgi:quinol-cytochrome oxidoreductase complex cytochrome b subunit
MNVFRFNFVCKLNWSEQVVNAIKNQTNPFLWFWWYNILQLKDNSSFALLLPFFDFFMIILKFAILPFLDNSQKQQLLSSSANTLRSCKMKPNPYILFYNLHKHSFNSTPEHYTQYKLSLLLFEIFMPQFKTLIVWTTLEEDYILTWGRC